MNEIFRRERYHFDWLAVIAVGIFTGLTMFFTGCTADQNRAADFKLYGKTLDDEDFDWQSLRGKYVLVKFTATWCPPCKAEIPGMLEAYEKYRDQGFEIVSVYISESDNESIKQVVEQEQLPWIIISEPLTEKAGLPPQGKHFGIRGVPTMFIVDKEGNICAGNTRGPALPRELEQLFGN